MIFITEHKKSSYFWKLPIFSKLLRLSTMICNYESMDLDLYSWQMHALHVFLLCKYMVGC